MGYLGDSSVVLVKPRTFVNLSGEAVVYIKQRFSIQNEKILVIYDDMDLPVGSVRLKAYGGSGGHNGINSINHNLESSNFPRLRVGIDRPSGDHIDHVLGIFSKKEEDLLANTLKAMVGITKHIIECGIDSAMNEFN